MPFRCPYCRRTFGPAPAALCPHCDKGMIIPDRLLKHPYRQRKKLKDQIVREAEKQRPALLPAQPGFSRRPATVFGALLLMLITGVALLSRTATRPSPVRAESREATAGRELQALRIALERFHRDCGRYPDEQEGLRALVLNPGIPDWHGPYVNIVKPDPWHTPYDYHLTNATVRLRSRGPDRKANTVDDLRPEPPAAEDLAR